MTTKLGGFFMQLCSKPLAKTEEQKPLQPKRDEDLHAWYIRNLRDDKAALDELVKTLRTKSPDYVKGFCDGIDESLEQPAYLARGSEEIQDALHGEYGRRFDDLFRHDAMEGSSTAEQPPVKRPVGGSRPPPPATYTIDGDPRKLHPTMEGK